MCNERAEGFRPIKGDAGGNGWSAGSFGASSWSEEEKMNHVRQLGESQLRHHEWVLSDMAEEIRKRAESRGVTPAQIAEYLLRTT